MSLLTSLTKIVSPRKKRRGRGIGSGVGGHTVGRGTKGQKSRTGGSIPLWFEGGQLPLIKRMPMWRGKGKFKVLRDTAQVSLSDLEKVGSGTVTLETLKLKKIINKRCSKAKVIANGTLKKKVTIQGLSVSKAARKVIEDLGGSIKK